MKILQKTKKPSLSEKHSEPSQTSKMKFLAKIAHGFLSLTIFAKGLLEILNSTGNTWMLLFVHKTARFVIVNNDINLSFFTW